MHNKEKTKKTFFGLFFIITILVVISLYYEFFKGHSVLGGEFKMRCPVFLQASSIYEVIKVIGLTNILIGWIYAKIDNKMLSISYSEILNSQFPLYGLFAMFHFLATLACIAVSKAGLSESSILLLIATLLGFLYQGIVFYKIILSSKKCEALAKLTWQEKIKDVEDLDINALNLAGNLPEPGAKYYGSYLECFTDLFIESLKNDKTKNKFDLILHVWDNLNRKNISEQNLNTRQREIDIFKRIFKELKRETNSEDIICQIVSAYITYRIIDFNSKSTDLNITEDFTILLRDISNIIYALNSASIEDKCLFEAFSDCARTTIYLLTWVYFFDGRIDLTTILREEIPQKVRTSFFDDVIESLFPDYIENREKLHQAIDFGKKMIKKRIEVKT